jgi:HSP20 family protein
MLTIKEKKFPTRIPDFHLLGNTFRQLDKIFLDDFENLFPTNRISRDFVFNNVKSNFLEDDKSFSLEIQVPGVKKDLIDLSIDDFTLKVEFNKKEEVLNEDSKVKLKEFKVESFSRSFLLPKSSDLDKITSEYVDGILFINIPKKESEIKRKRTIKVK